MYSLGLEVLKTKLMYNSQMLVETPLLFSHFKTASKAINEIKQEQHCIQQASKCMPNT